MLFGDVQLVVDEILQKEGRRFRLKMRSNSPLIGFLYKMSADLKDSTIWYKTIELLPDAEKRLTAASPVVEKTLTVPPLTLTLDIHSSRMKFQSTIRTQRDHTMNRYKLTPALPRTAPPIAPPAYPPVKVTPSTNRFPST